MEVHLRHGAAHAPKVVSTADTTPLPSASRNDTPHILQPRGVLRGAHASELPAVRRVTPCP